MPGVAAPACPPEYHEQTPALQEALRKETDFAFKQSFAFCPYSPEAVFRYVQFLMQYNRFDDALLVAKTCLKLDPYNGSVSDLIKNLEQYKDHASQQSQMQDKLQDMMKRGAAQIRQNYTNLCHWPVTTCRYNKPTRRLNYWSKPGSQLEHSAQ